MNEKFVTAFYALLAREDMLVEAAGCLTEMVLKKMEPRHKVSRQIHSNLFCEKNGTRSVVKSL